MAQALFTLPARHRFGSRIKRLDPKVVTRGTKESCAPCLHVKVDSVGRTLSQCSGIVARLVDRLTTVHAANVDHHEHVMARITSDQPMLRPELPRISMLRA